MAAVSGKLARVRVTAGTATQSTNEAATLSTDGVTLLINASSKRHWDRSVSSTPRVYSSTSTGTAIASSLYSVNKATGVVTFTAAKSTSLTYTLDVDYLATSYLTETRAWSLDISNDMLDTTAFSTSATNPVWRTFKPGLSQATVTLDRFATDTTGPTFFDRLTSTQDLIVELVTVSTASMKYEGFARIARDGFNAEIASLGSESVDLQIDGQLSFTTY